MNFILKCINCGTTYPLNEIIYTCRKCNDVLEVQFDIADLQKIINKIDWKQRPPSVWKFKEFIPVLKSSKIFTLHEGGTPLYKCGELAKKLKIKNLYVKNEGANPTGSFKDRGMTVGVTKAKELNVKAVSCASTGNTSASLAGYAAKAQLKCIVLIPSGKIALGKLSQAMRYGAEVIAIKDNFDIALDMVREASNLLGLYLLNSINPFRIEGQKTAAFEICEQLGWQSPHRVILPVGNAGNITAYWKGFKEFHDLDIIGQLPKMTGVQSAGASPIVEAIRSNTETIEPVKNPETIATAIRIGHPINWRRALNAITESNGAAEKVTDQEIISAQKLLATTEGIFVEPASAASIAGLKKQIEKGEIDSSESVVCITTGHGLKDPEAAMIDSKEVIEIEPDLNALTQIINR